MCVPLQHEIQTRVDKTSFYFSAHTFYILYIYLFMFICICNIFHIMYLFVILFRNKFGLGLVSVLG